MTLLITEQVNPETVGIDEVSTLDLVRLINEQDRRVADAVAEQLPRIAAAIDAIVERWQQGGRLFYVGTGTSGRLGVLDAVECPPTFGISPDRVQAIIAGGYEACWQAIEVAEDDPEAGAQAIIERGIAAHDAVVGIAASGRTPFTLGAVRQAKALGALTIGIACNPEPELATVAHICITPIVGPEVIAGSTRLKAGTAQKMVLNMLSTGVMIRLGYTYDNLMANLQLKNDKLRQRACSILQAQFGVSREEAINLLNIAQWDLKVAFVMRQAQVTADQARDALAKSNNSIKRALGYLNRTDQAVITR